MNAAAEGLQERIEELEELLTHPFVPEDTALRQELTKARTELTALSAKLVNLQGADQLDVQKEQTKFYHEQRKLKQELDVLRAGRNAMLEELKHT